MPWGSPVERWKAVGNPEVPVLDRYTAATSLIYSSTGYSGVRRIPNESVPTVHGEECVGETRPRNFASTVAIERTTTSRASLRPTGAISRGDGSVWGRGGVASQTSYERSFRPCWWVCGRCGTDMLGLAAMAICCLYIGHSPMASRSLGDTIS